MRSRTICQGGSCAAEDLLLIRHLDTQGCVAGRNRQALGAQRNWNRALEIVKLNYGPDSPEYDNILVHFAQACRMLGE
jgi:hypothetical protein